MDNQDQAVELVDTQLEEETIQVVEKKVRVDVIEVETDVGNVKVYRRGDPEASASLIALTDVATTYETCYESFFDLGEEQIMYSERVCIYVIEMVGQSAGDETIGLESISMNDYVEVINNVRDYFEIKRFVGMGVGIGAFALLHYTLDFSSTVQGLVLFSCPAHRCGWFDWFDQLSISNNMHSGKFTNTALSRFITKFFSSATIEANPAMVQEYQEKILQLNPTNVAKVLRAYLSRPSISARLNEIQFKCLLFIGKKSDSYSDHLDLDTLLKFSECIEARGADLITVESPDVTTEAIDNYLYSVNV
eukprot:TRINITY_DN413_c0_g1_i1.p1 TRINITY_DN413_c0_g1~~TRINITY_DN413_c0_g1_i1.p1  ORF type:complete len:320 (-),score=72.84 TRINITY_DN413_c0_g1_i1:40-957(-)